MDVYSAHFSKRRKLRAAHIMAAQVPENFVVGQMHHMQHVVPGHTKQTLLKQCLVSQTSCRIISKLGVPVATHSCPPPALSSAHCTNVLHHPGSSDVGQRDHRGQLLRRDIQQPLDSNRHHFETRRSFFKKISGNKLWAMWNTPGSF